MSPLDRYTCEEVFLRLDDFLDRELDESEMTMVREHLDTCQMCAAEFAFEASVLSQVRDKLQRIDAPQDLLAKLRMQIDKARRDSPDL